MGRLTLIAPMLIFGVLGFYFLFLFNEYNAEGPFYGSLVPELIGFCLEGFFLIGLFSLIQNRRERERKEELCLSLRGSLRELLSHIDIALLGEYGEPAESKKLEEDAKAVANLIFKLADSPMDVEDMARLKAVAARNLTTIHDLIPVAAQLSADHIRWWLAITESVRTLSEATDSPSIASALHRFLANLGEFDQLTL